MYPYRNYAESGGLMAYAPDLGELAKRKASDVAQILASMRATSRSSCRPNSIW
jgi:putative ABC transport system substrate-binding protein